MDNFDINESWLVKINQNLEQQQESINTKDYKFFNLGIFMDLARMTQMYSYECEDCKKNKDLLENMSLSIAENINTIEGRRQISNNLDKVATHLRKKHKKYIRRYISSLITMFGLLAGLVIGLIGGLITDNYKFYVIVGGGVGLCIGSIWGSLKEKFLSKNGQIYGKW